MKMPEKLLDLHKNMKSGSRVHTLSVIRCLIILITDDFIAFERDVRHGATHAEGHGATYACTHDATHAATKSN